MPFAYESGRITLFSRLAEARYGYPINYSDASPFLLCPNMDKSFTDWKPKKSNNQDDAQGNDFATESYVESFDAERSLQIPITAEDIGYWLLGLFGAVTTTQPDAGGNPSVYQHVFTLQDGNTSRQLLSRTIVEMIQNTVGGVNAYNAVFGSMIVESLSMKPNGTARSTADIKLRGQGRKTIGSGLTPTQALARLQAGRHYFFGPQANVVTKDNNNTSNSLDYGAGLKLESWGIEIDNAVMADEGYCPGNNDYHTATTAPVRQVETATVVGTIGASGSGNATVIVTAANMTNSPKTVSVAVANNDTAAQVATKIRAALNADADVSAYGIASGATTAVILTANIPAANDGTLNIDIDNGTCTGLTAAHTSANTTAGVAGVYDPASGKVRSELLFGRRALKISEFTVRMNDQTKELADLLSQRPIDWALTYLGAIIAGGTGAYNYKLIIQFPLVEYDAVQIDPTGISKLKITPQPMFDTGQGFAIKATLINTISSYVS